MTEELKEMIAKTTNRDGLARLFDHIAELCREPLVFTDDDAPTDEVQEGEADG